MRARHVDAAMLSRRSTSHAPSRTLDEASDDLKSAGMARDELEAISGSARSSVTGQDDVPTLATAIERLVALAAECERRAASLRSSPALIWASMWYQLWRMTDSCPSQVTRGGGPHGSGMPRPPWPHSDQR